MGRPSPRAATTSSTAGALLSAAWPLLAAAWAALVWVLLTMPVPPTVPTPWLPGLIAPAQDKLGHAGLFFVQAALLERALRRRLAAGRPFAAAFALSLLLGGATELRQRSVPQRQADLADLAADAAGALLYGAALLADGWRSRGSSALGS